MMGSRLMCMLLVPVMVLVIHVGTAKISGFSSYQWRLEPVFQSSVDVQMKNYTRREALEVIADWNRWSEPAFQSSVDIKETVDVQMRNDARWEALEVIADRIRSDSMRGVKQKDVHLFHLWKRYKRSSRSKPAEIVKEIEETLAYLTNVDSSINTIGLLLFGPQKGRFILRSVRDPRVPVVDDWKCLRSAVHWFEKHCYLLTGYGTDHILALASICNYMDKKAAIEEAFIVTCNVKNEMVVLPNRTRWEVLEAVTNRIKLDNLGSVRQKDVHRFYLWQRYKRSSRSERVETVKEIRELFTHVAYLDRTMNMIGMLLFGPENGPLILRSASRNSLNDDWQCHRSSIVLFEKHCAVLSEDTTRHPRFFSNICNSVAVKTSIEEAFIAVCGRNDIPYGIDVINRHIDITPKPIHGSSQGTKNVEYCERVSVRGIWRMELWSYAKAYRLMVIPSLLMFNEWHKNIQICLHRDASLGLCMCEKDDWRSMQKGLWSSVISPYEQNFVDVKFVGGVSGYVSVTLDEVLQGWRCAMLAVAAVTFCLTLHYAISFFKRCDNEPRSIKRT